MVMLIRPGNDTDYRTCLFYANVYSMECLAMFEVQFGETTLLK